jgi:hypothetical protein
MTEVNGAIVSEKKYNMVLGGTVFYGLMLNVIMCALFGESVLDWAISTSSGLIILMVIYVICAVIGVCMSRFSSNPAISFIGYNFIVVPLGLLLSVIVSGYVSSGMGDIVFQAIVITAITTFVMIVLSCVFPNFFSKIGGILACALIGLIISELIALIIFRTTNTLFAWAGAAIFSLYIGYDYWRAQQYPKTVDNAIDSAIDIYLDIINLFIRILAILSNGKSRD